MLNLTPAYPRSDQPEDIQAARIAELFQTKSFLDPSVLGEYPEELVRLIAEYDLTPEVSEEELAIIKENRVDFLGVNYYQPLRVQAPTRVWKEGEVLTPEYFFAPYDMPGKKINPHRGWEIYEKGFTTLPPVSKKNTTILNG